MPVCTFSLGESGVDDVSTALRSAEEAYFSAYLSVLEAERAGGDVSGLVARLNFVSRILENGCRAYESGVLDGAVFSAGKVLEVSDAVERDAVSLRSLAELRGETVFRNRLVLALFLTVIAILLFFRGWIFQGVLCAEVDGV